MIEARVRAKLGTFSLDAEVAAKGTACVAGRNGAGKTTLLRAVAGLLKIDAGLVRVGGADVSGLPAERRGVVLVTPSSAFLHLDVDRHILWGARLRGVNLGSEVVARVKGELGIDFAGPVRKLSLGMKERVSLATALVASPRAVLVDEAFSNLHGRGEFVRKYGMLARESGVDLLFTCQDEEDGESADRLYSIEDGSTRLLRG